MIPVWLAGALPGVWKVVTNPAVLVGAGIVAAFLYGRHVERQHCNADALRAELAVVKSDRDIARAAAKVAAEQGEAIAALSASRLEEIIDLEAELKKRPDADRCRASAADLKRVFGK